MNSLVAQQVSDVLKSSQLPLKGWVGIQAGGIALVVEAQNIDEIRLMQAIRKAESLLKNKVIVIRSNNLSPAENRKMLDQFTELAI